MSHQERPGWIKIHRSIIDWEWYHNDFMFKFFTRLIIDANFKPKKFEGRVLQRGQVLTGRKALAEKLNSTPQRVRTALERLKSTGEITIESTNKYSIISIVNYELYAHSNHDEPQRAHDEHTTSTQRTATPKNEKNIIQLKDSLEFERVIKKEKNNKNTCSSNSYNYNCNNSSSDSYNCSNSNSNSNSNSRGALSEFKNNPDVINALQDVPHTVQQQWLKIYSDSFWIEREILKAINWLESNPNKLEKSMASFLSSWIARSKRYCGEDKPTDWDYVFGKKEKPSC